MNSTKYKIKTTSRFKKNLKKLLKRGKDHTKIELVVDLLSRGIGLEEKYKDHKLLDDKIFYGCRECHIEPDWLLVYRFEDDILILVLVDTGSHSDLF